MIIQSFYNTGNTARLQNAGERYLYPLNPKTSYLLVFTISTGKTFLEKKNRKTTKTRDFFLVLKSIHTLACWPQR